MEMTAEEKLKISNEWQKLTDTLIIANRREQWQQK